MSRPSLRDVLLASLQTLPNTVPLELVVLASAPKRTTGIFPHAPSAAVRCVDREYLVVVSCGLPDTPAATPSASASASTTPLPPDTQEGAATQDSKPSPPKDGKVLAAAISAHVYTLPNQAAKLVYISKVDSSGYASACGALTRVLSASFISYFLSGPGTVAATLFARAQGQYLFPNSVEGGGKRVLGGLGLCAWWKRVFEEAAAKVLSGGAPAGEQGGQGGEEQEAGVKPRQVELSYLLPSYSAAEAAGMLPSSASGLPAGLSWRYAPPFTHRVLPGTSLATLIPSLPDDPKTRFLEELVDDALDKEPYAAKRPAAAGESTSALPPKHEGGSEGKVTADGREGKEEGKEGREEGKAGDRGKKSRREREQAEEEDERRRAYAALEKVPADEFWERMGFRQECASGDVTGFFHCAVVPDPEGGDASAAAASEAAEALASASHLEPAARHEARRDSATSARSDGAKPREANTLSPALVERILTSMLNTDFGTRALAAAGTESWTAATRALVVDALGEGGWEACTGAVAAKTGVERAPKRKEETVTMLQPRKKKR